MKKNLFTLLIVIPFFAHSNETTSNHQNDSKPGYSTSTKIAGVTIAGAGLYFGWPIVAAKAMIALASAAGAKTVAASAAGAAVAGGVCYGVAQPVVNNLCEQFMPTKTQKLHNSNQEEELKLKKQEIAFRAQQQAFEIQKYTISLKHMQLLEQARDAYLNCKNDRNNCGKEQEILLDLQRTPLGM